MEYVSIRQMAAKWGISKRRIQILCQQGRIFGAVKIDTTWVLPSDAQKPKDRRFKAGKDSREQSMGEPKQFDREDDFER